MPVVPAYRHWPRGLVGDQASAISGLDFRICQDYAIIAGQSLLPPGHTHAGATPNYKYSATPE